MATSRNFLHTVYSVHVCVCVRVCMCVCVHMCVCVRLCDTHTYVYTHMRSEEESILLSISLYKRVLQSISTFHRLLP